MKKKIVLFLMEILFFGLSAQTKIITKEEFDSDSLLQERRKEFLTPSFIADIVGTSFATKKRLENDLKLIEIKSNDEVVFYNINGSPIGIRYYKDKNKEVCVEFSLRLFGDEGSQYEDLLIKSGFVLKKKKQTHNLELEGDLSSQLRNGELRIYNKKDVVCEVMEGSYLGFSFYRVK